MAWTTLADEPINGQVTNTEWNERLGVGGNLQFLYDNAWIPIAVSTSELTTTSAAAVDLLTFTLSRTIGINDAALVQFEYGKQAGTAGAQLSYGLKLNGTIIYTPGNGVRSSATNQAEAGIGRFFIPPRSSANYGFGPHMDYACFTTAGAMAAGSMLNASLTIGPTNPSAAVPNAEITAVVITAAVSGATARIKNAAVYLWRMQ